MNGLKLARMMAGMTQQGLAKAVDISETKLSKIETGRQLPDGTLKKRLAEVLGRSIRDVFASDGAAPPTPPAS